MFLMHLLIKNYSTTWNYFKGFDLLSKSSSKIPFFFFKHPSTSIPLTLPMDGLPCIKAHCMHKIMGQPVTNKRGEREKSSKDLESYPIPALLFVCLQSVLDDAWNSKKKLHIALQLPRKAHTQKKEQIVERKKIEKKNCYHLSGELKWHFWCCCWMLFGRESGKYGVHRRWGISSVKFTHTQIFALSSTS